MNLKITSLLPLVVAIALSGCAELSTETKVEEGLFQISNAVDTAQTIAAQREGCYRETGELGLTGPHPHTGAIVAYQAAFGLAHLGITKLLQRYVHTPWILTVWQFSSLSYDIAAGPVGSYWQFGGRMFPNREADITRGCKP